MFLINPLRKAMPYIITVLLGFTLCSCFLWNSATPEEYRVPEGYYRLQADFSNGALDGRLEFLDVPIKSSYYDPEAGGKVFTNEAYAQAAMEISR